MTHCDKKGQSPLYLQFSSEEDCTYFINGLNKRHGAGLNGSHLDTTESSALESYFYYYSKMSNQMNMLEDSTRTRTYRDALILNPTDFSKARVMDVGGGTGILSFFASQAGADTV